MRHLLTAIIWLALLAPAWAFVPPHGALPTEAQCASRVPVNSWEPRPENAQFNGASAIPTATALAAFHAAPLNFIDGPPASDFANVDGNYSGATWQIIQWAACKWGLNANDLAAEAWEESGWTQTTLGDEQFSQLLCFGGPWNGWEANGSYCWTSYGVAQEKAVSFNTMPYGQTSTAFNLDFRGAYWRACMNGDVTYFNWDTPAAGSPAYATANANQRYLGCLGAWYSGSWDDAGSLNYQSIVAGFASSKPWLALGNAQIAQIAITSPQRNATISGVVTIQAVGPIGDPQACYMCSSVDAHRISCNAGPWTWDTTWQAPNGIHSIAVDTYTCPSNKQDTGPWYHAGINVDVEN